MSLSNELVSQFVKAVNDEQKPQEKTEMQGTVVYDGRYYVRLDGSEVLTPVTTSVSVKNDDRVTVSIKNHSASVTKNMTDPSASSLTVKDQGTAITEMEILVANRVTTDQLEAQIARIDTLVTDNVAVREELNAVAANIDELTAEDVTISGKLTATDAAITKLETEKLDAKVADATYATIANLEVTDGKIYNLEATYGEFQNLTVNRLDAAEADIDKLETDKLSATEAELKYANIDFANINMAAVEKLFSESGIIKNLIVSDSQITGELVGVTIKGDLIEGNTVVADKLVVKGEDGLYYKLNTDGVTTEAEQTDYNSLNGTVIQAKSITAEKIAVDDLVAFGATIGGFNITENALYSDVKAGPLNTTRGVYLDNEGQFSVGDSDQYIRYFKDTLGNYKLEISASSTVLTSTDESVEEALATLKEDVTHAEDTANTAQETADNAESLIKQVSDNIAMLVTDGNGTSLMTQTDDGWVFSTSDLQAVVDATSENLGSLINELGSTNGVVDVLQQAVDDLGILTDYIKIGTYENEPCIKLGETDSNFKLLITNTRILFMEGSDIPAYINNQSLYIEKAVIKEELQQGDFVWQMRSNGNLGLVWKGVSG